MEIALLVVAGLGALVGGFMTLVSLSLVRDEPGTGIYLLGVGLVMAFLGGRDLYEYREAKKSPRAHHSTLIGSTSQLGVQDSAASDGLAEVRARHQEIDDAVARLQSHDKFLELSNLGLRDYIAGVELSPDQALSNQKVRERLLELSQGEDQRQVIKGRIVVLQAEEKLWSSRIAAMEASGVTPAELPRLSKELAAWVEESDNPEAPSTIRGVEDLEADGRLRELYKSLTN